MPKNLLYIRLFKAQGFHYGVPKNLVDGYEQTFDIDNFSDTEVVNSAIHFLNQENIKVILECEPTAPLNKLMHLFNSIRAQKNIDLETIGEHQFLNYLRS